MASNNNYNNNSKEKIIQKRSNSPEFSETLSKHVFTTKLIQTTPPPPSSTSSSATPPAATHNIKKKQQCCAANDSKQCENNIKCHRSLEEISKDIKEIEDFITVTEEILRREKERDIEFYARERQRKLKDNYKQQIYDNMKIRSNIKINRNSNFMRFNSLKSPKMLSASQLQLQEKLTTNVAIKTSPPSSLSSSSLSSPPPQPRQITYKINNAKIRKCKTISPKCIRSRLYFRNGKIGCIEANQDNNNSISNIQYTHNFIKHIIKLENEKPLVAPEDVNKILNEKAISDGALLLLNNSNYEYSQNQLAIGDGDDNEFINNANRTPNINYNKNVTTIDDNATATLHIINSMHNITDFNSNNNNNNNIDGDDDDDNDAIDDIHNDDNYMNIIDVKDDDIIDTDNDNGESDIEKCRSISQMENSTQLPGSVTSIQSNVSLNSVVKQQVRHLVRRFTLRTSKMRTKLELPPTPSSSIGSPSPPPRQPTSPIQSKDVQPESPKLQQLIAPQSPPQTPQLQISLLPNESVIQQLPINCNNNTTNYVLNQENKNGKINNEQPKTKPPSVFEADRQSIKCNSYLCPMFRGTSRSSDVLDPQGYFYISWLCIVSLSFLYNAWVIPFRSSFPYQTPDNLNIWLSIDICADIVYLLDVAIVKHRLMYLYEGFWVRDKNLTRKNYLRKLQFKMDMFSLTPWDLLYLKFGTNAVYLRAPRLLKIQSFWEFFKLLDRVIAAPHMVRVTKTLTYMLYMIHLTACTYYSYSDIQGLGTDRWVFNGKGHPYVRCFAFATKTATSIGKNPKPETDGELLFMTAAWLMGVFVFALLIGQIRDIFATATRSQSEYRQLVDETLEYMRRLNLPRNLQKRVKMWFKFTWEQQRTMDEGLILDYLPANLKTDIAISVHIQTLSKVQLFSNCEEALLRDLVLKLRSVTFLPGDYVCRRGEVGKEMYIVKLGQVQVMGGPSNDEVLATLSESSVFGEISLLAINGAEKNRRTKDVRSKGFSNLFVLSKSDLSEAIVYYPKAQAVLRHRAKSLMRRNAARERESSAKKLQQTNNENESSDVVISNRNRLPQTPPPKLLQTVIQALPEESPAVKLLTQGSKRLKQKIINVEQQTQQQQQQDNDNNKIIQNNHDKTIINIENERKSNSLKQHKNNNTNNHSSNNNQYVNLTDTEKCKMGSQNIITNINSADENVSDNIETIFIE